MPEHLRKAWADRVKTAIRGEPGAKGGWWYPPDKVTVDNPGRYMVDVYYVGGNDSLKQPGWKEQMSRVTLLADSTNDALMTAANMLIAQGFFVTRTSLLDWPDEQFDRAMGRA